MHSVIRFPEFEVVSEKIPCPRVPHRNTVWEIVPAIDVLHAPEQVEQKHKTRRP